MIIRGQAKDAVAHAIGVVAVDETLRDVAVEIEIALEAALVGRSLRGRRRGAAIQDRILLAVDFKIRDLSPVVRRQGEPRADDRARARYPPAADQVVHTVRRIARQQLALTDRPI